VTRIVRVSTLELDDMKAILIKDGKGPSQNLYIGDAPDPSVGPGEVLVKVRDTIGNGHTPRCVD